METTSTSNSTNASNTINKQHQDNTELDLDAMQLTLEPHLRPSTPDPNSHVSQEIFEEHMHLAQEYLKVIIFFNFLFCVFCSV